MLRAVAASLDHLVALHLRWTLFRRRSHRTDSAALREVLDLIESRPRRLLEPPPSLPTTGVPVTPGVPWRDADLLLFRLPSAHRFGAESNHTIWGQMLVPRGRTLAGPAILRVHPWIGPTGVGWLRRWRRGLLERGIALVSVDLPHHARRTASGDWSGEHAFSGDLTAMVRAASQGVSDLLRTCAWLRDLGVAPLGVMGYSMGGWGAAMLAAADPALAFAVAAVPPADVVETLQRSCLAKGPIRRNFEASSVPADLIQRTSRLLSPLQHPAVIASDRLLVVSAQHDVVIPPSQSGALADHWRCEHWREAHGHMSLFLSRRFGQRLAEWMAARL